MLKLKSTLAALMAAASGGAIASTFAIVIPLAQSSSIATPPVKPITVSPAAPRFDITQVDSQPAPIKLTISNPQDGVDVQVHSPTWASASVFSHMTGCDQLQAGSSCDLYLYATSSAPGDFSDTLTIPLSHGESLAIPVSGSFAAMQASMTPNISFDGTPVGSAVDQTVTLKNNGLGRLSLTKPGEASIIGEGFSLVSTTCSTSLGVDASCDITVRMTPSSTAALSGSVLVQTGAGELVTALSGFGQATSLTISSGPVASFGRVNIGNVAKSKEITLRNTGNIAATDLTYEVAGEGFTIASNTCNVTLSAGSACAMTVNFEPPTAGVKQGSLNIKQAGQLKATSPLTGTGSSSAVFFTSNGTGYFPIQVGIPRSMNYKVQNTGQTPIDLYGLDFGNLNPNAQATIRKHPSANCESQLAGGATCYYQVEFQAFDHFTGTGLQATLSSSAGDLVDTQLAVHGSWSKVSSNISSIALGSVPVGGYIDSPRLSLTDSARDGVKSDLTVALPKGVSLIEDSCKGLSTGNATCVFKFRFNPTEVGAHNGVIRFTTAPHNKSQPFTLEVPLTATAIAPSANGFVGTTTLDTEVKGTSIHKVQLVNKSDVSAAVGEIKVSGTGFSLHKSYCGSTLPAKQSCLVDVAFSPSTAGVSTGLITTKLNGADVAGTLTGKGVVTTITANITAANFQDRYRSTNVASAYHDIWITLSNKSTAAMEIKGFNTVFNGNSSGHQFTHYYNACHSSIPANATCRVMVRAAANQVRSFEGEYRFIGLNNTLSIPFKFNAVAMDIPLTTVELPADVAVGKGSTGVFKVSIPSGSKGNPTVYSGTLTGNTAEYSIASGTTCRGATQTSGSSCEVRVLFTPSAKGVRPPATMSINIGGETRTVNLQNNGL